jgi:hypothetical protein
MKRIYANTGFARRMNISTVIALIALPMGVWELWRAVQAGPEGAGGGFLFAALFIGGGAYALRQMFVEYGDRVVALDADAGGASVITIWRPLSSVHISGPLAALSDWRFEMRTARSRADTSVVLADHPKHPRPLKFELVRGVPIADEFRALAPDVVETFERGPAEPAR